jgi:ribokinase
MPKAVTIAVVGSLNVDYFTTLAHLPRAGETVLATGFFRRFGGKGANQAVAAARQGAKVRLIGCVGDDDDGRAYIKRLRSEKIDTSGINISEKHPTGAAFIAVDLKGENTIIVSAGANGRLKQDAFRLAPGGKLGKGQGRNLVVSANALLVQFEVPLDTVLAAIRVANRHQVPVILNPSPFCEGFPWGCCALDTLIVNELEVERIFGARKAKQMLGTGNKAALQRELAAEKIHTLIITRGARSTICLTPTENFEVPAFCVKPVDTVGAGDTFAGTYAARRAEGIALFEAIQIANCAAALATLKPGAQEAMPDYATTKSLLRNWAPGRRASPKG